MEALKKLIDALPFPIIAGLACVVAIAWLIKEYNGLSNYSQVLHHKLYQSLVVIVCLSLIGYYAITHVIYRPSPIFLANQVGILLAEFSEDASDAVPSNRALTQTILDETRALRSAKDDDKLIKPLGRTIDPRKGRDEALRIAREEGALAIVWGWHTKSAGGALLRLHFDVVPESLAQKTKLDDPNKSEQPRSLLETELSSIRRIFSVGNVDSFEFYFSTANSVAKLSEFIFGFAKYVSADCAAAQAHFERSAQLAAGPELLGVDFFARFYQANCKYLNGKSTQDYVESLLRFEETRKFLPTLRAQRSEYQSKLLANEGAVYLALGKLDVARQKTEEALSSSEELIAAAANLGIILFRQGQNADAAQQLRKVLIKNPKLIQARYFLVLSLHADGRTKEAKAELADLLPYLRATSGLVYDSSSTKERELNLALLETYFASEDVSGGVAFLRNFVERNSHMSSVFSTMNPTATFYHAGLAKEGRLHLANLHFEAGQIEEAQKIYEQLVSDSGPLLAHERLISIYETKRNSPLLLRALVRYGTAAYTIRYCGYRTMSKERQHYLENIMVTALDRALTLSADDAQAHFKLGLLAFQQGRYESARSRFREVIRRNATVADVHFMLGKVSIELGDKDAAKAALQKAIELNPKFGKAANELGLLYVGEEQWEEALRYLSIAGENKSYSFSDECRGDWGSIATKDDDSTASQYFLALCLFKLGRAAEADVTLSRYRLPMAVRSLELLLDIRRALDKTEKFSDIYAEIGRFSTYKKDKEGAARAFENAVSYDRGRVDLYNYLAGAQIALNNIADGEKNLDTALVLNPDDYGALVRKGHLYLRRGMDADAERVLQRAKTLDPNKVAAQYLLGVALLRLGQVKDAIQEWELASKISYHNGRWSDFYSELKTGFDYGALMSEINLQLATIYRQRHEYAAAADRLSPMFIGMAGDVFSTVSDGYLLLAQSFVAGTFDPIRIPVDLRK